MYLKKIFLKSLIFCLVISIPFSVLAAMQADPNADSNANPHIRSEVQEYIDKISVVQQDIAYKINTLVPNFSYIGGTYNNILIEELKDYNDLLTSFATGAPNLSIEEVITLFNERMQEYKSLTKKIFIYKSCDDLAGSIQDNYELVNTVQSLITTSLSNSSSLVLDNLSDFLATSTNSLIDLEDQVSDLIISVGKTSFEDYKTVLELRKIFLETGYASFLSLYRDINDQIIADTEIAIDEFRKVSKELSEITSAVESFYAGGSIAIEVLVRDYLGRALENLDVDLSATQDNSSSGITINPRTSETDSQGIASFEFGAERPGYVDFIASVDGVDITANNFVNVIQTVLSEQEKCEAASHTSWVKGNDGTYQCVCLAISQVWSSEQGQCISREEQECLDAVATSWVKGNDGTYQCVCLAISQVWSSEQGQCISREEQECLDGGGTWDKNKCVCPEDYTWNSKTDSCEEDIGSCKKDEVWNPETKKCEKKVTSPEEKPEEEI